MVARKDVVILNHARKGWKTFEVTDTVIKKKTKKER
jgi:hypothetical protein